MKEIFAKNMEVQYSLMEFLLQTQGAIGGFLFEYLDFMMLSRAIRLSKHFHLIFS